MNVWPVQRNDVTSETEDYSCREIKPFYSFQMSAPIFVVRMKKAQDGEG